MKKVLLVAFTIATGLSFAQVTDGEKDLTTVSKDTVDGWKKGIGFAINGSQVNLTNWVAGGQNSLSGNANLGLYANLKRGDATWENSLTLAYGLLRQSEQLFRDNGEKWIKTDDRIDLTSKYGRKAASSDWYYAALLNFRTQSTAGYNYAIDDVTEISGFLAPAYLITPIGMDFKPTLENKDSEFSLFVAPITSKLTFVNDEILSNQGAFGVDPGSRFRSEFGGYLRTRFKTKLAENITFTTNLDLFTNYRENPERIDVNWETLLEVKLWKVLYANLSTHLIYDDDIDVDVTDVNGAVIARGPRVQFKQVLGVGLAWKLEK